MTTPIPTTNRFRATCWTAVVGGAALTVYPYPGTAAEVVMKPDLSYRSTGNIGQKTASRPQLSDVKRIYDEESLDNVQTAALEAMHKASETNPLPRGKRIPRR